LDSRSNDDEFHGERSVWSFMFTGTARDLRMKTGYPERMMAKCHPDQPHHGLGMCKRCYDNDRSPDRRRSAKTPEQVERLREKARGRFHALTPEQRERVNEARRFSNISAEKAAHIRQKERERYHAVSPEQRERMNAARRAKRAARKAALG